MSCILASYVQKVRNSYYITAQCDQLDWDFSSNPDEKKQKRTYPLCKDESEICYYCSQFDRYKITFPYFVNAPKSAVEGETLLQTKLTDCLFGAGAY